MSLDIVKRTKEIISQQTSTDKQNKEKQLTEMLDYINTQLLPLNGLIAKNGDTFVVRRQPSSIELLTKNKIDETMIAYFIKKMDLTISFVTQKPTITMEIKNNGYDSYANIYYSINFPNEIDQKMLEPIAQKLTDLL